MEAHRQSYKEKMRHFRDKTKCLKKILGSKWSQFGEDASFPNG
jgi:hypothetical protein